jgi:hypothetical protein
MALDAMQALMTDLGKAMGLSDFPPAGDDGYELTIGDDIDLYLYAPTDDTVIVVAPVAEMPAEPGFGLVQYLLRKNLFDSDTRPFVTATDEGGNIVFWGQVPIASLTGESLAALLQTVGDQVAEIRGEIGEEDDEPGA